MEADTRQRAHPRRDDGGAGVYMLCRIFFVIEYSDALPIIAWIADSPRCSRVIAVQQNDIKRILAYSTLSQLGYMSWPWASAADAASSISPRMPSSKRCCS